MDYGKLLADSWKTVWKHKAVLAFGALSGLPLLAGFLVNVLLPDMSNNLFSATSRASDLALSLLALGLLIGVAAIASILAQTGILSGAREALDAQTPIRVGPTLARGVRYLARVLGAWLVIGAVFLLIVGFTLGCQLILSIATAGLGTLCTLPFVLAGTFLLGVGLDTGTGLTAAGIVLDDFRLPQGLRMTWTFTRRNTTEVIVTGLLLSALLRGSTLLLAVPELIISFLTPMVASPYPPPAAVTGTLALALQLGYLPVHIFGMAVAQALAHCGWAGAYLRLSRPAIPTETS